MALSRFWVLGLIVVSTACKGSDRRPSPAVAPPEPMGGTVDSCGPLRCSHFPDALSALREVLATRATVVAFGESHALRGAEDVLSATERFGAELLPVLRQAGARTLVVELINPPTGCEADKAAVERVQKPVVERQDGDNQARFVQLGHQARALGMVPLLLEPTCEEFGAVRQSASDGISSLLGLITTQTQTKLERLAARAAQGEMVIAYGGALHNDVAAAEETKPFAFGAALLQSTHGRYIAVDLIVPEFIGETEAWKALPWYPYWPQFPADGVMLVESKPQEYTILLERGRRRAPPTSGVPSSSATPTIVPSNQ